MITAKELAVDLLARIEQSIKTKDDPELQILKLLMDERAAECAAHFDKGADIILYAFKDYLEEFLKELRLEEAF